MTNDARLDNEQPAYPGSTRRVVEKHLRPMNQLVPRRRIYQGSAVP